MESSVRNYLSFFFDIICTYFCGDREGKSIYTEPINYLIRPHLRAGSVAGPVKQANGRLSFVDDLGFQVKMDRPKIYAGEMIMPA